MKKINAETDFYSYLQKHQHLNLIIQEFIGYKYECGIFYHRIPSEKKGKITSLNWIIESDRAEIDYYIEEIYTKNLKGFALKKQHFLMQCLKNAHHQTHDTRLYILLT